MEQRRTVMMSTLLCLIATKYKVLHQVDTEFITVGMMPYTTGWISSTTKHDANLLLNMLGSIRTDETDECDELIFITNKF